MANLTRLLTPAGLLALLLAGNAEAVELPPPDKLAADIPIAARNVSVIEPHESTPLNPKKVEYKALPLTLLLRHWFGSGWGSADADIVFLAKDGYRSVVPARKLQRYAAYLAFARADGRPFRIENYAQNERKIPLGPYYLIWDNANSSELLRQGSYGWPYQVTEIERQSRAETQALLRPAASPLLQQGYVEAQTYCLTCHHIRGIGGKKYTIDLIQAVCGWQKDTLQTWIESPSRVKPGTTMPALAPMLPEPERKQAAWRIVNYLKDLQHRESVTCPRPD